MRTLVALSYSPWSEKARWALDHHGVEYRLEEYTPMLGELALRIRAGKLRGPISVPMLFDGKASIADSLAIARRADQIGGSAALFPEGENSAIEAWNSRSEQAMAAARALLLRVMARDEGSQRESIPSYIPQALRSSMRPIAALGIRYVAKKYGGQEKTEHHESKIVEALEAMRSALVSRRTILSSGFSYADIVMAVVLQFVKPVADEHLALGPATRDVWTHPGLAARYGDLLAWRDDLYQRYRRPRRNQRR